MAGDDDKMPPGYFNATRFGAPIIGPGTPAQARQSTSLADYTYVEGSDVLATKADMVVSFLHEPSQTPVFFKAFITSFNETYNSDWATETVFGRTDPIHLFRQTARRITLALKIPAATYSEAYDNLANVQTLIQFLYPNYTSVGTSGPAQTIAQNPYIRLKVMNLARQADNRGDDMLKGRSPLGSSYGSSSDPTKGLLGVITNLTVNHNLENADAGVLQLSENTILPKLIEINLDFNVVHEHRNGWSAGKFDEPYFPYGANTDYREGGKVVNADFGLTSFNQRIKENQKADDEKVMAEQDRANAEARYRGLFVKARFNKDKKFMGAYEERQKYLDKGIHSSATDKEKKKFNAAAKKQHTQRANYDYLSSTTRGGDQDGDGQIDAGFIE